MEYALKYGQNLKGLVISNMMSSIPKYNEYAKNVIMPAMDQKVLAEIQRQRTISPNWRPPGDPGDVSAMDFVLRVATRGHG